MTAHPTSTSRQTPAALPVVRLISARSVPGYLPGMNQPVVLAEILVQGPVSGPALAAFDTAIAPALPHASGVALHPSFEAHPVLGKVVRATRAILERARFSALDDPVVYGTATPGATVKLALPCYAAHQEIVAALAWAADLMNRVAQAQPADGALEALPQLMERIARYAPDDSNTPRFLAAARMIGIPWRHVQANIFQFGWGSRARRLESTITGATAAIGVAIAKDKWTTARVLRAAGIPVPHHELAADADQAVRIAARLGYPVVVKPANRDGALGVGAGLPHEAAVRRAFAAAREFSDAVLVETFVEGNDYRVDVFNGQVYAVTLRVPGGITGDGDSSVRQLLAQLNADPRRGEKGSGAELKRIALDAEALELLTQQALGADSVPPAGQFVRLRGAANVAVGGIPHSVIDKAHPDNLALCGRAARVVGLDVAGIDLLIPDIGRSWLETGAGICEVNGKPQLSVRDVETFFGRLLPTGGRIPVVVVLGHQDKALFSGLSSALASLGCVGTAWATEVRVGSNVVAKAPADAFHAGQALLTDPDVDVAVLGISGNDSGLAGMPVDRFDVLVLAGAGPAEVVPAERKRWDALALTLAPLCRGEIILASDCAEWNAMVPRLNAKQLVPTSSGGLADAVRRSLQKSGHELAPRTNPR